MIVVTGNGDLPLATQRRVERRASLLIDRPSPSLDRIYQLGLWLAIFFAIFLRLPPNKFPRIPPDVSPVSIRLALAMTRKNYVFAGPDSGGVSCGRHVHPHRDRQDERPQPGGFLARRARPHLRSPDQSHRRAAALELAAERADQHLKARCASHPPFRFAKTSFSRDALRVPVNLPTNEQASHRWRQRGRRSSPDAYPRYP